MSGYVLKMQKNILIPAAGKSSKNLTAGFEVRLKNSSDRNISLGFDEFRISTDTEKIWSSS